MNDINPVTIERELREAVRHYSTLEEVDMALENTKVMSSLAPRASDRALCLQRMIALHSRRKELAHG